jgi:hypothetical protein
MNIIAFDTLSSAKRLREKGFTPEQAEAVAEELQIAHNFDSEHFTKKPETELFKSEMKHDFQGLRSEFQILRSEVKSDIEIAKRDLTIRMGGMMIALVAFLSAIKFFG